MKMLNKVMQRLKNVKVIVAVVSGLLLILVNLQVIDVEMSVKLTETVNTILSIGVAVGIFGNPDSHVKE